MGAVVPDDLSRIEASLQAAHGKLDGLIASLASLGARVDGHDREIGQLRAADASQDEAIVGLRESRAAAQGGLRASGWLLGGIASAAGIVGAGVAWLLAHAGG